MESLRRFFTLEEENYSSDGLDSESLEAREAPREPGCVQQLVTADG